MSWQAYVDNNLVGTKTVTQGAILGQEGGVWAATPGLTVSLNTHLRATNLFISIIASAVNSAFLNSRRIESFAIIFSSVS